MDAQIIEAVTSQGLGVGLSIALVFYIIRTQERRDKAQCEREESYHKLLNEFSKKLVVMDEIRSDVKGMREDLLKNPPGNNTEKNNL